MEGAMTEGTDEAVKGRCEDGSGAVVEQQVHAAARCSIVASKSMARRTEVAGTS
jgi:hypothetical protein